MVAFEILNDEDQQHIAVEDHIIREKEIESLLSRYTSALVRIKSNPAETKAEFESIIKSKYFKEKLEKISDIHDSSIHVLKYCVYKNYATLLEGPDRLKYFEMAIDVDPSDLKLLLKVSDLRMEKGDYQECLDRLLQALVLQLLPDERVMIMVKIQKLMYDYGCFREALEWGNLVLKLDPNEKTALGIKAEIIRDHLHGGYLLVSDIPMQEIYKFKASEEFIPHVKVEIVEKGEEMDIDEPIEPESDFPIPDENLQENPNEYTEDEENFGQEKDEEVESSEKEHQTGDTIDPNPENDMDVDMQVDTQEITNLDLSQKASDPEVHDEDFNSQKITNTESAEEQTPSPTMEVDADKEIVKEDAMEEDPAKDDEEQSDSSEGTQKKRKPKRKRVSERVKRQHTVEEEEEDLKLEEITTLNQNLPPHLQFTENGLSIAGAISDYTEFNNYLASELLAKQITRKKIKRKVHALNFAFWDQTDDHAFFTSTKDCQEFIANLSSNHQSTISMIVCKLIIKLIEKDVKDNTSSAKMYAILSVLLHVCSRTTSVFDFIIGDLKNSPFFGSIHNQIGAVLFIAEMLFDSILDSSKKEFYEDCDEEIGGTGSINPLVRCSRLDLFNRAMTKIRQWVDTEEVDPSYVLRYYWLIAKREEVVGTPYTVVKSLEDCVDFYNVHYPKGEVVTVLASTTENKIDRDSISFKIKYQQLRLHIDETQSLMNDMKLEQVVERLESLLLNMRSNVEIPGKDIINQMPPLKRLELMEMLKFSELIHELVNTALQDSSWKAKYLETPLEDSEFSFVAFTCVKISWIIAQNIKDISVSPKNTFHSRMRILKNFCANSWVLFAHYLAPNRDDKDQNDKLSEILIWAHDQLGKFGLCGGSDGIFLKYNVNHISKYGAAYDHEIYQCYACLYGTELKANPNQYLWDHKCKHSEFDEHAAVALFKFLKPILMEKMSTSNFRMLPKDLRFCMDLICKIYPEPPLEQVYVKSNLLAIKALLSSDIHVKTADPSQSQNLAVRVIPEYTNDIPGKVLLNGYYNKQEKDSATGLNTAIEKFIQHLALKPFDMDAWVSLATCYTALAYEILSVNITSYTDRIKIAEYQKVRVSVIIAPMNSMVIKNEPMVKKLWETKIKESSDQDVVVPTFTENSAEKSIKYLYGIMAFCFKKAISYNSAEWSYYYRLAHVYRKLEKEPDQVTECYLKAISIMPSESTSKEQDPLLDPIYKCASYLLKCKQNRSLRDVHISETIDKLCALHPQLNETFKSVAATGFSHLASQPLSICKLVFVLVSIKKVDKRRWYHKPYYRLAWMYLNIIKQPELAKEEMCSLLNIKSKAGMRKLWKTDLELPGRFYIYYHQYIKFLIEVATLTNDVNVLWNLSKKLKTEEAIMLQQNLLLEARKSILAVLSSYTKVSDQDFKEMSVKSTIDPEIEKRIAVTTKPKTDFHSLHLACELKRSRKSVEPALEKFILNLYCKLYLEASKTETIQTDPASKPKKSSAKDLSKNIMARALAITKNIKEE
ncbi:Histone transcription regulator 3 [Boothiomyces sp. JEL0838]|nr:Histone transcription regulator 3 [Boothiomyces sp. JEL0838]